MAVRVQWLGTPGHFIGAHHCRFRLTTEVGEYLISTVGLYFPFPEDREYPADFPFSKAQRAKPMELGYQRTFETMVFPLGDPCQCTPECPAHQVREWSEVEMRGYNDVGAATAGHQAMIDKYIALQESGAHA